MPRGDGTRRGKAARSGPSGPSIPEAQRHTRRVVVRLSEADHALWLDYLRRLGCGASEGLSWLVRAEADQASGRDDHAP